MAFRYRDSPVRHNVEGKGEYHADDGDVAAEEQFVPFFASCGKCRLFSKTLECAGGADVSAALRAGGSGGQKYPD